MSPLAHERLLPVHPVLARLFGDPAALPRGQTVACVGTAAMSCALTVLGAPTQSGSWAAVVGVPAMGISAAGDLGVALERTVFVADPVGSAQQGQRGDVAAVLSALVDGFDVLLLARRLANSLPASLMRRLQTRVQSRGSVLVVVGEPQSLSIDVRLTATTQEWEGVGLGYGHLTRRRVLLQLDGRRRARATQQQVWLPDQHGQLSAVETVTSVETITSVETVTSGNVVPLRRAG